MEQDSTIEIWEAQVPGAIYAYQRDPRQPTGYRQVRVGGGGSKRLRITAADREFTQEQVIDENRHLDPFTNGSLRRVDGGDNAGVVTDEDLFSMVGLSIETFNETVNEIDSELTLRRLREVVEERGTVAQLEVIRDLIEDRYKVGGTQKTVREMMEAQEISGGEVVSG